MRELAESDLPDPAILDRRRHRSDPFQSAELLPLDKSLALQAAQLPWGLYSAGEEAISIVPALEATALEADRYRSEIHPWISLQALLRGSPDLLHGYPAEDVQKIRAAWRDARAAYFNRGSADSASQFAEAMRQFTADVRALAEAIEPDRQQLPIVGARPGAAGQDGLSRGFRHRRRSALQSGRSVLLVGLREPGGRLHPGIVVPRPAQAAFLDRHRRDGRRRGARRWRIPVRMYITHWAPVTSMFETIVWVAMCMSLLTLWVTFLPLLGPTSKAAWAFDGHSRKLGRQAAATADCGRSLAGPARRFPSGHPRGCPGHAAGVVRRRIIRRIILHGRS